MFIGTEKLTHTYMPGTPFANQALSDVSFDFKQGSFSLILGPSGSGKSTLIQHLNGLLKPTSGRVFFEGKPVEGSNKELLRLRRCIGLVFQMPEEQFFSETIYDELAFAPRNLGLDEDTVTLRVKDSLQKVGLSENMLHRHPFQLSAGQKRLAAIAAVLSLRPQVLVLDEPTAALDMSSRKKLFQLLVDLNLSDGLTIIIATHHLDEAAELADRVLVLESGKTAIYGSALEVFSHRDELRRLGLALPPVTDIMADLADRGLPVSRDVYNLKRAREEINKLKGRQQT